MKKDIRLIAINLPQYHPFKENDEWWGKGFTEWANVTKAKPRFPGHYQPHLPADLGFYDLRLEESRIAQAELAKEYGIYGFCYYHYWFNGHQLMERPLEGILSSGKPDFPFMLCWANENWNRAWDGGEKQILIKQDYSEADDREHIRFLIKKYFSDPRYIRVNGKPVFCIYKYNLFPNIKRTISIWREEAQKSGIDLYLCYFESYGNFGNDGLNFGFDAAIEFQPHEKDNNGFSDYKNLIPRIINKFTNILLGKNELPILNSYKSYVKYCLRMPDLKYKRYPCVTPGWDNSPRRKGTFFAFIGSSPTLFGKWLKGVIKKFTPFSNQENFIFINAWNEWAEGNHLEPDQKWGKEYLAEVKRSLEAFVD